MLGFGLFRELEPIDLLRNVVGIEQAPHLRQNQGSCSLVPV